jgi:DNA-binding CsgD family transcriptional regulator
MIEKMQNSDKQIFLFAKDKNLKYLFCNEAVAEVAGMDSPSQIVGKTDYDLFWRQHAEFYRDGDKDVLQGNTKINAAEIQTQPTKVANIMICKMILYDRFGNQIGVGGHYIDTTGYSVTKNKGYLDREKNKFWLGPDFSNEYLTKREFQIFRYLLLGYTTDKISHEIKRSVKTVQSHIKSITRKLQCTHQAEIVPIAIRYGLTYVLDGIVLHQNSK